MLKYTAKITTNIYRNYSQTRSILNVLNTGQIGESLSVQGWIKALRKQKDLTFVDINDGSTCKDLQLVLLQQSIQSISVGASVSAQGILKETRKGQRELSLDAINVIGECSLDKGYPFAPRKTYEQEYIREYLHLRPKTRAFSSVLRLRHAADLAIRQYLDRHGYFSIHTPILTANDCEGAGETFKVLPDNEGMLKKMAKENQPLDVAYFDNKSFLTVSGQLHLESAAQALSKVYCFGPTFRAENSKSRFHLSEFYMLELEEVVNRLDDLLSVVEDLVKSVTIDLLNNHFDDIETCSGSKVDYSWTDKTFERVSYEEAKEILTTKLSKSIANGISKEDEHALTEYFNQIPVFIINWPKAEKPFYMKETADNNVAAFDLLGPNVGEIAGGSLREDNYEKLKSKLPTHTTNLDWYLDLRKFGNMPTGGFGLGFERYLQFVLGINNIKDCIPFPRWPHNCRL